MDEKKREKTFYCKNSYHDKHVWWTDDFKEDPDSGIFVSECPLCNEECPEVSYRYRNMAKAWENSTGPKTEAGKARSRLNGWKHGARSQAFSLLAPALHGKYPQCENCQYSEPCESEPYKYCPMMIQPVVEFMQAYKEGNPAALKEIAGLQVAQAFRTLQMMFADVQKRGIVLQSPKLYGKDGLIATDEDGETIYEISANPILAMIPKFMELIGNTAEQQEMTPRQNVDEGDINGVFVVSSKKNVDLGEYIENRNQMLGGLKKAIQVANHRSSEDDALKRFEGESAKGSDET